MTEDKLYSSIEEVKRDLFPDRHARERREAEERDAASRHQEELLRPPGPAVAVN